MNPAAPRLCWSAANKLLRDPAASERPSRAGGASLFSPSWSPWRRSPSAAAAWRPRFPSAGTGIWHGGGGVDCRDRGACCRAIREQGLARGGLLGAGKEGRAGRPPHPPLHAPHRFQPPLSYAPHPIPTLPPHWGLGVGERLQVLTGNAGREREGLEPRVSQFTPL